MSSANGFPPRPTAEGLGPGLVTGAVPLVVGVLLTADRPEMTRRAIRSFGAQTYENKRLLIFDSGAQYFSAALRHNVFYQHCEIPGLTIGTLRNLAVGICKAADIIAHFDSDDWSHPRRIEEQVALLQSSGADAVGYNDMLFAEENGAAWWYSHGYPRYALGASLCYWRKSWERVKFAEMREQGLDDKLNGEDSVWLRSGINCVVVKCWRDDIGFDPRMICGLHAGNSSSHILPDNDQWKRVPEWDDYCRKKMEVKNVNV